MSRFILHTLGCGSAKPSLRHNPSSFVVDHRGTLYMIDCGEGAQLAFMRQHLKSGRLRHIFLTHLHGDHVLGLVPFLSTLSLGDAGGTITIHTFAEGKRMIEEMMHFFAPYLSYTLEFNVISPDRGEVILDTGSLSVRTVPLRHRVPDVGFVFEEPAPLPHIVRDMCDFHGVPVCRFQAIKEGADFVKPDGTVVPHEVLTTPGGPGLSYAHISDTLYMPELAAEIGPVDLLYHETTYTEEHRGLARDRFHSTALQAATVARDAGAGQLLTGHYSSRYKDDSIFVKEAAEIFPAALINYEGRVTPVGRNAL